MLGRKGTFALRNTLSSIYYALGGLCNSSKKESGITAMVCTYNEEDWIDISLLSIRDLVDEYIVVDSSTDSTPQRVMMLKENYNLPIRFIRVKAGDLVYARNLVLKEAKYRWILHWDADFVATSKLIYRIRDLLKEVNDNRCYLVYWKMLKMCASPLYLCPDKYHIEHWMFTWSSKLHYKWLDHFDSLIAPIYLYRVIFIDEPLGIHLTDVRSPKRLAMKRIWWKYRKEADEYMRRGGTLEEFARMKAISDYGIDDLYELGRKMILETLKQLEKCNEDICKEIPITVLKRAEELGIPISL